MKTRNLSLFMLFAAWALVLSGCNKTENADEENVGMANPASVYCEENGWILKLEEGSWICMFEDGSYCEEWSYKNGECQPGDIMYNTIDDDEFIDDVVQKIDWNGSSKIYSHDELQAAVDTINNYVDSEMEIAIEMQEIFYQWDEESAAQLDYCKSLDSEIDECVVFKTNFYIPDQNVMMAWAFEPDSTITGYEWYLGRTNGGEWKILTMWF